MNYFKLKLNEKINYLHLIIEVIVSIIATHTIIYLSINYIENLSFNIFNVIPLDKWILAYFSSIALVGLTRSLFFPFFFKLSIIDNYFKIFFHIIKFGLLVMPIFFLLIMILSNKIVFESTTLLPIYSLNNLLLIGSISSLFIFLIWIYFLSKSINNVIGKNISSMKLFLKNSGISLLTFILLSSGSFSFINIELYKNNFINEVLEFKVKLGEINESEKNNALNCIKSNF